MAVAAAIRLMFFTCSSYHADPGPPRASAEETTSSGCPNGHPTRMDRRRLGHRNQSRRRTQQGGCAAEERQADDLGASGVKRRQPPERFACLPWHGTLAAKAQPRWFTFTRAATCARRTDQPTSANSHHPAKKARGVWMIGPCVRLRKPSSIGMPSPGPVARPRFRSVHPRMCSEY
jgi:hypothetical protein